MRWIIVVGLVTACDESCPLPPLNDVECVEDGLEAVSLQGTWTLTGTTTEGYEGNLPPRTDIIRDITFDGCRIGSDEDFARAECGIDDNIASCKLPSDIRNEQRLVVCKNQQDELVYKSFVSMHRIPRPYVIYVNGVLNR